MIECQARDLEVRVWVPVQVQIFLLKFNNIYICCYICFCGCKMGRWFIRCPAYQSGPGKDGFRIDVSMESQSSFSRSLLADTQDTRETIGSYIYIWAKLNPVYSSCLHLGLPRGLFPVGLPVKMLKVGVWLLCLLTFLPTTVPKGPLLKIPHTDGGETLRIFLKITPWSSNPENKIIQL